MANIDSLYAIGDDALQNQFGITLPPFAPVNGLDADALNFRLINFSVPERSIETYSVPWRTQTLTKVGGKITTPNETSLTFRADRYWGAYTLFDNWLNYIIDQETGVIRADGAGSFRVDFSIFPIDNEGNALSDGWKFIGAFPSQMAGIDFDQDSGSPITVSVTMQFIRMDSQRLEGAFATALGV